MPRKKSGNFDKRGIEELAKDKPIVYTITDDKNNPLYVGSAKKGRVEARLKEHLPGGKEPVSKGKKVRIQQQSSIKAALQAESRIIKSKQPPQNKKGK